MEIKVKVNKNKKIDISSDHLGATGENLATTLLFEFAEGVPEGEKWVVFNNKKGSFKKSIVNNTYKVTSDITLDERVTMQVMILLEDMTWLTSPVQFNLDKSLNINGKNSFEIIKVQIANQIDNDLLSLIGDGEVGV